MASAMLLLAPGRCRAAAAAQAGDPKLLFKVGKWQYTQPPVVHECLYCHMYSGSSKFPAGQSILPVSRPESPTGPALFLQ